MARKIEKPRAAPKSGPPQWRLGSAHLPYPNRGKMTEPRYPGGPLLETLAMGKSGTTKCIAVDVAIHGTTVTVAAVNSRGSSMGCWIDLPRDPKTIRALARLLNEAAAQVEKGYRGPAGG